MLVEKLKYLEDDVVCFQGVGIDVAVGVIDRGVQLRLIMADGTSEREPAEWLDVVRNFCFHLSLDMPPGVEAGVVGLDDPFNLELKHVCHGVIEFKVMPLKASSWLLA